MGIGIDIVGWIVILPLALVLTPRAIELYWVYYFCERKSASNKTFICGCLLSAHEV
jgi:hypothetical protein